MLLVCKFRLAVTEVAIQTEDTWTTTMSCATASIQDHESLSYHSKAIGKTTVMATTPILSGPLLYHESSLLILFLPSFRPLRDAASCVGTLSMR